MSTIKIAVITGGHPFDVQPFRQLFRALPGIDAYIQHTDEFVSESEAVRDSYDALVFYSMFKDTPTDDVVWYAGKPKIALERLGETKQGIILLHHALLAYPDWPMWDEIAGMKSRIMRSYHPNERVKLDVSDPQHTIVKDLASWEMIDETYAMTDAGPDNHVLLTTDHPKSLKTLAWTRTYKKARVFVFASGHGKETYADHNFQTVLQRSIAWTARRI